MRWIVKTFFAGAGGNGEASSRSQLEWYNFLQEQAELVKRFVEVERGGKIFCRSGREW